MDGIAASNWPFHPTYEQNYLRRRLRLRHPPHGNSPLALRAHRTNQTLLLNQNRTFPELHTPVPASLELSRPHIGRFRCATSRSAPFVPPRGTTLVCPGRSSLIAHLQVPGSQHACPVLRTLVLPLLVPPPPRLLTHRSLRARAPPQRTNENHDSRR